MIRAGFLAGGPSRIEPSIFERHIGGQGFSNRASTRRMAPIVTQTQTCHSHPWQAVDAPWQVTHEDAPIRPLSRQSTVAEIPARSLNKTEWTLERQRTKLMS